MSRYVKSIANIFIAVLLLFVALSLTILIVYMVNDSFKDQDAILAGCIAFVGAIIGGFITLVGVNKTIQSNKELAFKNNIPKVLENIEDFKFQLTDAYRRAFEFNYPSEISFMFESEIIRRRIFKLAANIDKDTYQELSALINDFNNCKSEFGEFSSSDLYKDHQELLKSDLSTALKNREYYVELKKIEDKFNLSAEERVSNFLERLEDRKNNYLNQL